MHPAMHHHTRHRRCSKLDKDVCPITGSVPGVWDRLEQANSPGQAGTGRVPGTDSSKDMYLLAEVCSPEYNYTSSLRNQPDTWLVRHARTRSPNDSRIILSI